MHTVRSHVYVSYKRGKQMQGKGGNDTGGRRLKIASGSHTAMANRQDHREIEEKHGRQGEA